MLNVWVDRAAVIAWVEEERFSLLKKKVRGGYIAFWAFESTVYCKEIGIFATSVHSVWWLNFGTKRWVEKDDSQLNMFVLSVTTVALLEIPGHTVMLPVWPRIHRKKKNTHAAHITKSYFVTE